VTVIAVVSMTGWCPPGCSAAVRLRENRPMSDDELEPEAPVSRGFAPCFPVRDVRAALAHYEALGFEVMPFAEGIEWAWTRFNGAELHLFYKENHDPATTAAAADLIVDDVDEVQRRWVATGVGGTSNPYDTRYNLREAVHIDLDNNLVRINSPLLGRSE
jgi:hypothetical protein